MENVQNLCESSCHEVPLERFATNARDPPHWTLKSCFGAFRTIWVHLGPFFCPTTLSAKRVNWCNCSCHKVTLEFFVTDAPDPPHWTLNSCFGAFRTIWVHLGQFVALQHSVQNGPNSCKSSCHEVVSEFFALNIPIHPIKPKTHVS